MNALLLPGLAGVAGLLLVSGGWLPGRATVALSGFGAALALLHLLAGAAPSALALPVGPPGTHLHVALDGFASLVLLLLFVAAAAAAAPVLAGALALMVLAADGFSLVLAFAMAVLTVAGRWRGGRRVAGLVGGGALSALALAAALALQAGTPDLSFSAMRAHPLVGMPVTAGFLLTLLAPLPAGLALARAQASLAGPADALLVGAVPLVGLYLLVRFWLDLAGPAQPGWWGGVVVALGTATSLLGAARTVRADSIRAIGGAAALQNGGLATVGIGLALAARAADLAGLAAVALGATLLLLAAQAIGGTLLALAMAAAEAAAGTRRLDRLGGLLRGMPQTTACVLLAAASVAALPPSLGFAGVWLLLQALIGVARASGPGWQAMATFCVLAAAGVVALGAVAAVRLVGIAFLGRPRTPRAAAAQEPPIGGRGPLLALAALLLAMGAFPGVWLAIAGSALRRLAGADLADRAGWLQVAAVPQAPGLAAAAVLALLLLATLATLRLQAWRAAVGQQDGPMWEGGAAPPPRWMPFGDPATQSGPVGFAAPLDRLLRAATPRRNRLLRRLGGRWRALTAWALARYHPAPRTALATLLVATVLLLALVAVS